MEDSQQRWERKAREQEARFEKSRTERVLAKATEQAAPTAAWQTYVTKTIEAAISAEGDRLYDILAGLIAEVRKEVCTSLAADREHAKNEFKDQVAALNGELAQVRAVLCQLEAVERANRSAVIDVPNPLRRVN